MIAALVHERFEELRPQLAAQIEESWQCAADEFRGRVMQRTAAVRAAAEDLFDRPLPALPVPELAAVPDEFSYDLERLPYTGENVMRVLRWFLPRRWLRVRQVGRAQRRLGEQLDRHAGRVRHALVRRLRHARDAFVDLLANHLDEVIEGVTTASERGQARRNAVGSRLEDEQQRVAAVRAVTDAVRRAVNATFED